MAMRKAPYVVRLHRALVFLFYTYFRKIARCFSTLVFGIKNEIAREIKKTREKQRESGVYIKKNLKIALTRGGG